MSRARVLIVDDEPTLLRVLKATLESEGYSVLLASDGATALRRTREEEPNLVLLDVMMPVVDGWTFLDGLEELPARPRVICLTAKDSRRDMARAFRLGADDYVTKPFDVDDLLAIVTKVLARSPDDRERHRSAMLRSYRPGR